MGVLCNQKTPVIFVFLHAPFAQHFFIGARRGNCQIKHFCHGGTLCAGIGIFQSCKIIGGNASLLVGRPRQWNHRAVSKLEVPNCNDISNGIDIRVRGNQMVIDQNPASGVCLKAGCFCQFTVWLNTDRQHGKVRLHSMPTLEPNGKASACILKSIDSVSKIQVHPIFRNIFMQKLSHFKIQWHHYLILHFNNRNFQSGMLQIFGCFQTNKSAANDGGISRTGLQSHVSNLIRIRNRPECPNTR